MRSASSVSPSSSRDRGAGRRAAAHWGPVAARLSHCRSARVVANEPAAGVQLALMDLEKEASGLHYRNRAYFGAEVGQLGVLRLAAASLPKDARLARTPQATARVAQVRPRPASVFALGCHVGLRRRPALPAPRRPDRHGHHPSSRHRPAGGRDGSVRASPARRSGHFMLLADIRTSPGMRHRIFQVMPGAGTTDVAPSSYRTLRTSHPMPRCRAGVADWGTLSAFADHAASYRTGFDRASRVPHVEVLTDPPESGVVVLHELLEPTALGASAEALRSRDARLRPRGSGRPCGVLGPTPGPWNRRGPPAIGGGRPG